jgi:hypothetical protein
MFNIKPARMRGLFLGFGFLALPAKPAKKKNQKSGL